MAKFLTRLLITTIAALIAAYLLSGVAINGIVTAFVVAIVLALLNTFIKPLLVILTIPITLVTLGLFLLVINIIIIKLAAALVDGFEVSSWWAALLFSLIVSVVSYVLEGLFSKDK